jgi:GntR family histidine utilization transcriptional repressor
MAFTNATAAPYARVKHYLKRELAQGRWTPGALMPSEAELVAKFGVSRMTVNRAIRELQNEGLVERVQGAGTYAAQLHKVASTLTIRDLHEEIEARGHVHRAVVHLAREEKAGAALAQRLALATGTRVFHTLIVHHENGVPLQCEDRYVNPACAPGYLDVDFTRITPTHYLLDVAPLWEAQYSIEASAPTADEARLLGIEADDACLVIVRRTVSRGVPITIARLVHPGSRYLLQGEFRP